MGQAPVAIIVTLKQPLGRRNDDRKLAGSARHILAQSNINLGQFIGRVRQAERFIRDQLPGHFKFQISLAPIAQILPESRPIRRLDGIDLQFDFSVVHRIDRKNRAGGSRIKRNKRQIRAKQDWIGTAGLETQARISTQLLAKSVLEPGRNGDGIGAAAFGLPADLDRIAINTGDQPRDGRLHAQQVICKGFCCERIIKTDKQGAERRAIFTIRTAMVFNPQRSIGRKLVGLSFGGQQRSFSGRCAWPDGDRNAGFSREWLAGAEGQPAPGRGILNQLAEVFVLLQLGRAGQNQAGLGHRAVAGCDAQAGQHSGRVNALVKGNKKDGLKRLGSVRRVSIGDFGRRRAKTPTDRLG